MGARAPAHDPYAAWRGRDYRLFASAWFLVVFGKQAETVAVGWVVLARTGDPLSLGLVGLAQALPVMLLALLGGQLADRFDRQRVLMASLSLAAAASVGLAVVVAREMPVSAIYALLLISATGTALGQPSRAALVPQLVAPEVFPSAVAWSMSVFQTATLVGPAVGGLVLWLDVPTVFALGAGCRVAALLLVALLRPRPRAGAVEPLTLASLLAGARFVWRTKAILGAISLDMMAVLLGGFAYLLPVFAQDILTWNGRPVGEVGLGLLRSAEAVGALSMAVVLAHLPPLRRAGWALLGCVAAFGAGIVAFGLSRSFLLSLVLLAALGALDNVSVVIRHTLLQTRTPDAMRGRVSAVNNVFIVASNDLGGLESGVAARLSGDAALAFRFAEGKDEARALGAVASVILGGLGTLAVVAAAAALFPELRRVRSLTPEPEPARDERAGG